MASTGKPKLVEVTRLVADYLSYLALIRPSQISMLP